MTPNRLLENLKLLFHVYRNGQKAYQRDQTRQADVRVAAIMGAQVLKGGKASRALDARVRHAASLWRSGEVELLIPTGGLGEYPPKEADLMAEILLSQDVPREAILAEDAALNTWDSAVRVARICEDKNIECVRIVTDPLHCVRAVWSFKVAGLDAFAEPAYDSPMWRKLWSRRGQFFREAVALIWYRIRYGAVSRK